MTKNLNDLFGMELFIPAFGDPESSEILKSRDILDQFLSGQTLDDVLDSDAFRSACAAFPFNGEDRPQNFAGNYAWFDEETRLIEVAARRFNTPEDIQRFVMPGRSTAVISDVFRDEWRNDPQEKASPVRRRRKDDTEEVARQAAVVSQEADEQRFELRENMKFADVTVDLTGK